MGVVIAAPATVAVLARTLVDVGAELVGAGGRLYAAAERFVLTAGDAGVAQGNELSDIAGQMSRLASTAVSTGGDALAFVVALDAADAAGATRALPFGLGDGRLVMADDDMLATFATDASTPLVTLLALLRRRRELLDTGSTARPPFWIDDATTDRLARLDVLIGQLAAVLDAGRPPGWAGVGPEPWRGAGELFAAAALGRAMALALRPHADGGHGDAPAGVGSDDGRVDRPTVGSERTDDAWRTMTDAIAEADFARSHPFVASALAHGVLITPARLSVLVELDRLATAPIRDFVDARAAALADVEAPPRFDWSSDACSGPVVDAASDHCLQHDFVYRNARMVRDQWGLPQVFADALKRFADDRFARGVLVDTPRWPPRPELHVWSFGAGVVVRLAGSVDSPWEPPVRPR